MASNKQIVICVFCGASSGRNPLYIQAATALAEAMHSVGAKLVYGGGTVGIMGEVARTLVRLSGPAAVHGVIPEALVKYEQAGAATTSTSADASAPDSATRASQVPATLEGPVHSSKLLNELDPRVKAHPGSATTGGHHTLPKVGPTSHDGHGIAKPDPNVYGHTTVVKDMHTRKQLMAQEVLAGAEGSGFVALPGGYGTMEELMEITTWNQLGIHNKPICLMNVNGFYDGLVGWVKLAVQEGFVQETNSNIITEAKDPQGVLTALRDYKVSSGRFNLDWNATSPVEEKKPAM